MKFFCSSCGKDFETKEILEEHQKRELDILEQLLTAIHKPFEKGEDGHKHNYVAYEEPRNFVKRQCAICGYIEPITTVTRLID